MNNSEYIYKVLKKQKDVLEEYGYNVGYIALQGSQNYGLSTPTSDIDLKAVIIPNLDNVIRDTKPVSKTLSTEWGQCDVKDVRLYVNNLIKGNPVFLETLFTPYKLAHPDYSEEFGFMISQGEKLVNMLKYQMLRAIYGMMKDREKELCKERPSVQEIVKRDGYDGKKAHHHYRMYLMMVDYYITNKPFSDCLRPDKESIPLLMRLKRNELDLGMVKREVEENMAKAKELKDTVLESDREKERTRDYSLKNEYIENSLNIVRKSIRNEVIDRNNFTDR